ncbi:MAG TPA: TetR/AcrR family transcriptional regulator [Pyrinomonadaceae bacterium]|jgi:AcrR family transcriptional regulator
MRAARKEPFSRYDQKLEFILRTAAQIFAEKSYHSTSMRDISRATGVSLAGLYHYCRSKEELLFLIQDNCFGHVLERLNQRLGETSDPVERLRIFIDNHLAFFAANMAEMKVLSHEAESLEGEMLDRVAGKKQQYTRLARRILSEVQQALPEAQRQINLTVATYALFGMMNWIYNWYDPRGKLTVAELVETLTRLFLVGLLGGANNELLSFAGQARHERLSVWREPQAST